MGLQLFFKKAAALSLTWLQLAYWWLLEPVNMPRISQWLIIAIYLATVAILILTDTLSYLFTIYIISTMITGLPIIFILLFI